MTTKTRKVKNVESIPETQAPTSSPQDIPVPKISYRNKLIAQVGIEAVRLKEKEQRLASKLRKQALASA